MDPRDEPLVSLPRRSTAGALGRLVLLAAVAAGVVAVARECTRGPIADNVARESLRQLGEILPADLYDNAPATDVALLPVSAGGEPTPVYRARRQGQPAAAVLTVLTPDGYAGPIRLLVAIRADGRVLGVRVTEHHETPGIGDIIEARRSPWIGVFAGRSLGDPPGSGWKVRKDGGEIDQVSGATITSRAVVAGVARAGEYFAAHENEIFAAPARAPGENEP